VTTHKASTKKSKHRSTAKAAPSGGQKVARKGAQGPKLRARHTQAPVVPRPGEDRSRREALATAKVAIAAALDKKAIEPVLIDVCGRASYADFIAVVSGRSDRQVEAIAEGVCEAMAAKGRRPLGREGARNGRWILVDFGDVVMHVFYHPVRELFDIESLWIDAPRVKLQVPAEAKIEPPIDSPGSDSLT
jgi:ribosome-associated protein